MFNNPYQYSDSNKRYYTLNYHFKQKYGFKVGRIPIDAGFTCPNIDGTKALGGCRFCSINGSGDYAGLHTTDLLTQWNDGKVMMQKKWPDAKFIAYFQAFSNTYASVKVLKEKYEVFANLDECIGISIGTRPDCFDQDIYDYLEELNTRCELIVELGLQTINDEIGEDINRGHTTKDFYDAVHELKKRNIEVVVHIINGLAGETKDDMIKTAQAVADLNVDGIKIHLLHVVSGTKLVDDLNDGSLELLTREAFVDIVCDQLEVLPPDMVVHRLTGDAPKELFIGPIWSRKKTIVLNEIDKELKRRDSYQGKYYNKK